MEAALADGNAAADVYLDDAPLQEDRLAAAAPADESAVAETYTGDEQLFVYGFAEFLDVATAAVEAVGGTTEDAKMENFG